MADVSSQATLLRGGRFRFTGKLNYIPRTVKFSRVVNMASMPNPLFAITFDGSGTGAYTDVRVGMTVVVYHQNTDTVKGFLRVAYGGATSTVLQVNEVSKGTVDVRDNDRFEVIEEWDIWDVLVSASATFDKDSRRAYVDEGATPPPVSNSGGPVVGDIDPATGALLTNFFGDTSFVVAASGSLTHAWDFGSDATPPTSTSTNPATVSIPEGFRFALHTVTANGKSDVERVPVFANGPNYPALPVRMRSRRYTALGWTATFEVPIWAADIAVLRERGFIVYSETEQRGSVTGSFGSNVANRSHVKFAGYLDRTSIRISADETTISFDAISPLAVLQKTGALPQLLSRTGTGWTRMNDLNFWRALWYLLYWGSTAKLSHDFLWPDGQSYAYAALAVDNDTSIQGQLQDIGGSIKVEITCDMLGRILCVRNPNYLSISDRAARTKMYTFGNADLISADLEMEHRLQYKFVRGEALTPATTVSGQSAVYSDAPGPAPGPGTQTATLTKQIATQDEINQRSGDELAALNGTYYDETTRSTKRVPKGVGISLPDGYDVFDPAYREFVALPLNAGRYVYDANTRWLIDELSISYDEDGGKEITATVSHETHGAAGKSYFKPPAPPNSYPDLDDMWGGWGDFPGYVLPGNGLSFATADLAFASSDGSIHYLNLNTEVSSAFPLTGDITGTLMAAILDAKTPANILIATPQAAYQLNSLFSSPTVDEDYALSMTGSTVSMQSERGVPGLFVLCVYRQSNSGGSRSDVYVSEDSGETWTPYTSLFGTYPGGSGDGYFMGAFVSRNGNVYTSGWSGAGVSTGILKKSTNKGAAWSNLGSALPLGLANDIHISFQDVTESLIFHGGAENGGGFTAYRLFTTTAGGTRTDISPTSGGEKYGPIAPFGVTTCDIDANRVLLIGQNRDTGTIKRGVFLSKTRGQSWETLIPPDVGVTWTSGRIAGDDPNTLFLLGGSGKFGVSRNAGASWRIFTLGSGTLWNLFGKAA